MQCGKCLSQFNYQVNLPVIYKQGKTICLQCYKTMNIKQRPPIPNKQLLTFIRNRCQIHKLKKKSIYSITNDKFYCEDCLLFNPELKDVVRNERLIEAEEIQKVSKETQSRMCYYRNKGILEVREKFAEKSKEILEESITKIENRYAKLIQLIQQAKYRAIDEVTHDITRLNDLLGKDHFERSPKFDTNKTLKQQLDCLQHIQKMIKQMAEQANILQNKLSEIQTKQYFQCQIYDPLQQIGQLQLSKTQIDLQELIEQGKEEELLLGNEELMFGECHQSLSERTVWFKMEEETEISDNQSMISIDSRNFNCSQSKLDRGNKSVLVVNSIQQLAYLSINSSIKCVKACNLNMTNNEGRQFLKMIKQSFVTKLDFSHNKMDNNFILLLNKKDFGKYLREIKVQGNKIESECPAIIKKSASLQKSGLNIVF